MEIPPPRQRCAAAKCCTRIHPSFLPSIHPAISLACVCLFLNLLLFLLFLFSLCLSRKGLLFLHTIEQDDGGAKGQGCLRRFGCSTERPPLAPPPCLLACLPPPTTTTYHPLTNPAAVAASMWCSAVPEQNSHNPPIPIQSTPRWTRTAPLRIFFRQDRDLPLGITSDLHRCSFDNNKMKSSTATSGRHCSPPLLLARVP